MKRILRLFLLVLTLSVLSSAPVFADSLVDNGSSANVGDTGSATSGTTYKYTRSGFILYIVDQSGSPKTDGVLIRSGLSGDEATSNWTYQGKNISKTGLITRIGGMSANDGSIREETAYKATNFWSMPPFTDGGAGNGTAIKNWLTEPDATYTYKAIGVITKLFDYDDTQIEDFYTNNDILVIEPYLWSGMHINDTYLGLMAGTSYGWSQVWEPGHKGAGGAFQKLPLSAYLVESWAGVQAPTTIPAGQVSKDLMANYGFGMLMVSGQDIGGGGSGDKTHTWDYPQGSTPAPAPVPPKQGLTKEIVKVYRTKDAETGSITWDGAFYRPYTSSKITVENEPEYNVIEWETSRVKTPTTSPTAKWDEVRSNSTNTQHGTSIGLVELTDETTLYVLLEREIGNDVGIPGVGGTGLSSEETDVIRAWELNYIFPNFSGSRTGSKSGFNLVAFKFADFWQYSGKSNWKHDPTVTIAETSSGDITNFNSSKSYLYNTANSLWKIFPEAKTFGTSNKM